MFSRILSSKITQLRKPYGFEVPSWVIDLTKQIDCIQKEWRVYQKINKGIQIDELSKDQIELNIDKKWKSLFLYGYTHFNQKELIYFEKTAEFIKKYEDKITLVMFSTTEAGKHIPSHTGNNHGVLRLQIGIDIAEPEKCTLRVEDKQIQLKEKEFFIFDDTFEHELMNESNSNRTVLIIDYYKPLPLLYHILNKRKIAAIAKSDYVQSVVNKIK